MGGFFLEPEKMTSASYYAPVNAFLAQIILEPTTQLMFALNNQSSVVAVSDAVSGLTFDVISKSRTTIRQTRFSRE